MSRRKETIGFSARDIVRSWPWRVCRWIEPVRQFCEKLASHKGPRKSRHAGRASLSACARILPDPDFSPSLQSERGAAVTCPWPPSGSASRATFVPARHRAGLACRSKLYVAAPSSKRVPSEVNFASTRERLRIFSVLAFNETRH